MSESIIGQVRDRFVRARSSKEREGRTSGDLRFRNSAEERRVVSTLQ